MNRYLLFLIVLAATVSSCTKGIEPDVLEGTWMEQEGNYSKMIFTGDTFYFHHDLIVDTMYFALDKKHTTMWTAPLDSSTGGHSYPLEWHKQKKILVLLGLFPSGLGNVSKSYYKKL